MTRFAHAHAANADARAAFAAAASRIDAAGIDRPTLGWLYLTEALAGDAPQLLAQARSRWPGSSWVGAAGVGICASGVEYFDRPALALMLCDLPRDAFRLFSGTAPLPRDGFAAHTALVHADPTTDELAQLIGELADRTATGYLFGGLASSQSRRPLTIADGVFEGGLSGVAFADSVGIVSRVTQGCQPIGPSRRIDAIDANLVVTLDGQPALDLLLDDLGAAGLTAREALPRMRGTLVALADPSADDASRAGAFGADVRVRHLIGIDPARRAVAIGDTPEPGTMLAFCTRDTEAARRDLTRICTEVREELEPAALPLIATADALPVAPASGIAGAVYVSCAGRGGQHFGAPSAELAIVRRALGDVPLVGFFAAGEIGRRHLYGYTGVLTAFASAPD